MPEGWPSCRIEHHHKFQSRHLPKRPPAGICLGKTPLSSSTLVLWTPVFEAMHPTGVLSHVRRMLQTTCGDRWQ